MTAQHMLGYFLIIGVFVGIAFMLVDVIGWKNTLKTFLLSGITSGIIVAGVFLINT